MKSQSFFDIELPNDPISSFKFKKSSSEYYDTEDIGLAYENDNDVVFGVEVNEDNYLDDDDLGLGPPPLDDEDEIGLRIRLPDDQVFGGNNNLTPTPQDPINENSFGLKMNVPFGEFAKEVVYTLASKITGYCNVHELREDLRKDTGLLPDYVVAHYGFPNFETFIKSDLMASYIIIQLIDGKHYFLPKNCEKFAHIRNEQEIERAATLLNQNREENEKLCRALLPENKETTIKGRKLISELIYELGGEEKPVSWQDVQRKYKEKFNEELAGEALKRMFQRDKAIKIIETIFNKEIELFAANLPGQFFLKFKMPYNDLLNFYEEQLKEHNEAKAQFKNASQQFLRPKFHHQKQNKVFPVCPMYPTFVNPNPSQDKTVPFGGNKINEKNDVFSSSSNQQANNFSSSNNAQQKKSKFDISSDEIGSTSKKQSLNTTMLLQNKDEDDDIAEESRITVKYNRNGGWAEENISNVPAYEIGKTTTTTTFSRLDPPLIDNSSSSITAAVVKNGGGIENNVIDNKTTTKNKKINYTARIAGQDFTDSEESCDDEEEENFNKINKQQKVKETAPIEIPKQQSDGGENLNLFSSQQQAPTSFNNNNNIFVPPPRISGHRAGIQKFMQEKVEQRKMEAAGLPTSSSLKPIPPTFNPIKQRYPVTISSDEEEEEDDENDQLFGKKQKEKKKNNFVESDVGIGRGGERSSSIVVQQQQQKQIGASDESPPSLLPHQQLLPLPRLPNNNTINNNDEFITPKLLPSKDVVWLLIEKVEWLRALANKQKMSHESRPDEGSFIFRKENEVLVLTESDDKIRASKHFEGKIRWERYFPKTDWEMFSITIHGLVGIKLCEFQKMEVNNAVEFKLGHVPNKYKNLSPPYPAYRTTFDGQEFLCFFTKQYGFSNHYLSSFKIDGVRYCCSEQYYMYMKAMHFGFVGIADEIMSTKDTATIKNLGNANTMRLRQANGAELKSRRFDHDEWRKVKRNIMYEALYAKFEQNIPLFNMLIKTEKATLIEASPTDLFWGIGCGIDSEEIRTIDKWRGNNYLGNLLMKLRTVFQARFKSDDEEFEDCF